MLGTRRRARKLLGIPPEKIPYMKFKEIDLMLEVLRNRQPMRVLEYGCGFSTMYFPQFLPKGAEWVSIEHDREWFEIMRREIEGYNKVSLNFVAADSDDYKHQGDYSVFKSYVDFPLQLEPFDMVLVDGMAREDCIKRAGKLLKNGGFLMVHDANRKSYQPPVKEYPNWLIFEDFRKTAGGYGFASPGADLASLFDVQRHRKIWEVDTRINNFFKFKYLLGKKSRKFNQLTNLPELQRDH